MKKIEIDASLVTSLLKSTTTVDFRLSDEPFITLIKAVATLHTFFVLGIISEEELRNFQMMLNLNYTCFTEMEKVKAKQELNKEGDNN